MKINKTQTAAFIAILFQLSGLIGILFTPYRQWFIEHTALNLLLMGVLLVWTHPAKNKAFYLFLLLAFIVGMGVEMIGVNSAVFFGTYQYGSLLGPKLLGVPLLIGLNWFVVMICVTAVMEQFQQWIKNKIPGDAGELPEKLSALSMIVDGALLAVFFDWIMEPVAMKLGFWQWENGVVPAYNYLCWFLVSVFLLVVLRRFSFARANHFAVHLFIIQLLFFGMLRTFL